MNEIALMHLLMAIWEFLKKNPEIIEFLKELFKIK